MSGRGRFIVLEGVDGSGKSTLARGLKEEFPDALHVAELVSTQFSAEVRSLIFGNERMPADAKLALFGAACLELAETRIGPALDAGQDVICDRWFPLSSWAYQVEGGGASLGLQVALSAQVGRFALPDLVVLLHVSWELSGQRLAQRGGALDSFERVGACEFDSRQLSYWKAMHNNLPGAVVCFVQGDRGPGVVLEQVAEVIRRLPQMTEGGV